MRRFRWMCVTAAVVAAMTGLVPQPARAATTVRVFMSNFRFCTTPVCAANENVTIKVGDTVEWVFADAGCLALLAFCFHTSTRTGTGAWNSGSMPGAPPTLGLPNPKLTFPRTFTATGTFSYICSLHSGVGAPFGPMAASVIVTL